MPALNGILDARPTDPAPASLTDIPLNPYQPEPVIREDRLGALFSELQPISLEQTNELAQMLSRIDNKYVVDLGTFESFVTLIQDEFAVLEIQGRRQFTYRSCYYDDQFRCYLEHHQGRRQRCKVRTREYVDGGGMMFFEVKLKGCRGLTAKHRMKSDFVVTPEIGGEYLTMLEDLYLEQYKKDMPYSLSPSLLIGYKRCTLVALGGGERVTVDYLMNFADPKGGNPPVQVGEGFIIVETKSAEGKGVSDRIMKKLKVRKASNCSKYCIGANLIGGVTKNNNFRITLKNVRQNIVIHPQNDAPIHPIDTPVMRVAS